MHSSFAFKDRSFYRNAVCQVSKYSNEELFNQFNHLFMIKNPLKRTRIRGAK